MRGKRLFSPALAGCVVLLVQAAAATTLQEDFATDPSGNGWRTFGVSQLFSWDSTNQNLRVTWDSAQPNSYFYHSLGTILTRDDDFSLAFDLRLEDVQPGVNTNKSGAFELALGLLNLQQATSTNFLRGTGTNSPNLVEFDYFPDAGFGATIWPAFISTNSTYNYNGPTDFSLLALTTGDLFHVVMSYTASNVTLTTTITRNGAAYGPVNSVRLSTNFTDFRVDAFALDSYSDAGDDYDSILAHGWVDNLVITTPPPPVTDVVLRLGLAGVREIEFTSRTQWVYTLERSTDFAGWVPVSSPVTGDGSRQVLSDAQTAPPGAFYRVRAQRP